MVGKDYLRALREILNEGGGSNFLDDRTSYDYIWQAATEFVDRTESLKTTQDITTVASQATYNINANFQRLYMKDRDKKFFVIYNDGSANNFITYLDYEEMVYRNLAGTTSSIPSDFTILNASSLITSESGTATSNGALSNGQCTLVDAAADFTYVTAGDTVSNITDGSTGVVLSVNSTTSIVTALFDGTENDWDIADSYVIQPRHRVAVTFDPAPASSGHTITLPYIKRPDPVYSDFGAYQIQDQYMNAVIGYAAFLYKYRDREPNFGDAFFKLFDREVRRASQIYTSVQTNRGFSVSFMARR